MACRWRIRHKLMIGLGVVIAIIFLLLVGTFTGQWSHRTTMKLIDRKLEELKDADDLRGHVKLLIRSGTSSKVEADAELRKNLANVQLALEKYKQKLEETIFQGQVLERDSEEKVLLEGLRQDLDKLDREIQQQLERGWAVPEGQEAPPLAELPEIKKLLDPLGRTSDDLKDAIYRGLEKSIRQSKRNNEFSFGAVVSISVIGVLLLIGLLRRFYCWVFYPIRDLEQGAQHIAKGDFEQHIAVHSGDEMEELANAFNHMKDRLRDIYADLARQVNERSRQLVRSERLASVGFLAAGVAHEINNPLASIVFCSDALEHRLTELLELAQQSAAGPRQPITDEDRATMSRYLKMVQNEAMRCKEITQRLLEFSRGGEKRREPADLNEITQSVVEMVQHLQNCKGKKINYQPVGGLTAWVNAQEIKSVVLNLVVNSLESMDQGGTLTITQREYDGMAELIFQDTGCGMSGEVLENIFEPFFTRSRTGKGTGLGLSISHRIINHHGGEIEASSPGPNRGSTFVVRLPLKPQEGVVPMPSDNGTVETSEETYYLRKFAA